MKKILKCGDMVQVVESSSCFPGCIGEVIHVKKGTYIIDLLYYVSEAAYRCIGSFNRFELKTLDITKMPIKKYKVVRNCCEL